MDEKSTNDQSVQREEEPGDCSPATPLCIDTTFMDACADGCILLDSNLGVLYLNDAAKAIFKVDSSIIGENLVDLSPHIHESGRHEQYMEVLRSGNPLHVDDLHLPEALGNTRISYKVFKTEEYLGAIVRDVTQEKETEEALYESEARYRNLVEKTDDIVWTIDLDFKTQYVSASVVRQLGFTPEERKQQKIEDQMPPDSYALITRVLAEELALEESHDLPPDRNRVLELEYYHKDRRRLWFENVVGWTRDIKGNITGIQGISRNIDERKHAQEMLLKQQRIISLNHRIAHVFLTTDSDDVYADVLELILETMECRFGLFGFIDDQGNMVSPSLTRDIWDQCQMPDKSIVFPPSIWGGMWGRALQEKHTMVANSGLSLPEGHVPLTNAMAVPIIQQEKVVGLIIIGDKAGGFIPFDRELMESVAGQIAPILKAHLDEARQRSEREKLEQQFLQIQRMESIGTLAGGIAHDFNNILFPIMGMSEILLEDFGPDTQAHRFAKEIFKAGRRGSDLVKQILAFSRQSEQIKMPVQFPRVLEEAVQLSRSTIPTNIEINTEIQADCGLVIADPTQLHQVAINLITNAYHAVEEGGGTITVGLEERELAPSDIENAPLAPGKHAFFWVADNGSGIDPATLHKIFEPYFTTKEQGKGTGLGLAVVHGIIKEHKGDIMVHSVLGKGTIVKVYLPLIQSEKRVETQPLLEADLTGTERILCVDDEMAVTHLMGETLQRLGYQVTALNSSPLALEEFRNRPDAFDLVISDLSMPVMKGDALAKAMIAIRPDIPIIICTGFSDNVDKGFLKKIGIRGVLPKPVIRAELGRMIRSALDAH